jgi:SsrA-binding protein
MKGGRGLTLAPVSAYTKGDIIKIEIALARGRKDLEKRKLEKARDVKINQKREAKEFTKR